MTLQDIFTKMGEREWDFTDRTPLKIEEVDGRSMALFGGGIMFSLPDLLANKSWCKAVWGESPMYRDPYSIPKWEHYSNVVFQILQQKDNQACLNYIFKTMKK